MHCPPSVLRNSAAGIILGSLSAASQWSPGRTWRNWLLNMVTGQVFTSSFILSTHASSVRVLWVTWFPPSRTWVIFIIYRVFIRFFQSIKIRIKSGNKAIYRKVSFKKKDAKGTGISDREVKRKDIEGMHSRQV